MTPGNSPGAQAFLPAGRGVGLAYNASIGSAGKDACAPRLQIREEYVMRRTALLLMLMLTAALRAASEPRPLLPKPQKIQAGKGRLLLDSLSIGFAANPAVEDRFAAQQLSTVLSGILKKSVPVVENTMGGRVILLNRTGAVDPLPVPYERAGRDSRESYTLKITPEGA